MAKPRSRFYFFTAIALLLVTIWGFSQTYFAPLFLRESAFGGHIADLPAIVHVHGWSFFLWYTLLVVQATLIRAANFSLHRRLGYLSVALAAVMVAVGFVVVVVNIYKTLEEGGPPIWRFFGIAILWTSLLFLGSYAFALQNRRRPEFHKRLMLLAGVPVLGAATFRVLMSLLGPQQCNIPAGILLTNVFILAGMWRDWRAERRVHPVYWIALPVFLGTELLSMYLPYTQPGKAVIAWLSDVGEGLLFLYR